MLFYCRCRSLHFPWFWITCHLPPIPSAWSSCNRAAKCFSYLRFFKKKQCTGYEWTPGGSPPTGLPATDNYLAKISEGAGKTGSAGSSGNTPGSPTFSPPEGAFLTGGIIQGDSKSGQARADRWARCGGCLQAVALAVSKVQTANQLVSKCPRRTCREMNYSVQLLNWYFSRRAPSIAAAWLIASYVPSSSGGRPRKELIRSPCLDHNGK